MKYKRHLMFSLCNISDKNNVHNNDRTYNNVNSVNVFRSRKSDFLTKNKKCIINWILFLLYWPVLKGHEQYSLHFYRSYFRRYSSGLCPTVPNAGGCNLKVVNWSFASTLSLSLSLSLSNNRCIYFSAKIFFTKERRESK